VRDGRVELRFTLSHKGQRAYLCTTVPYCGIMPAARLIRLWRLLREVHLRTLPPESIKPAKYPGRGTPVLIPVSAGIYLDYLQDLKQSHRSRPR